LDINNLSFVSIKTSAIYQTKTTVLFIPFLGGQFQPVLGGQFEMAEGGQFHLAGGGQFAWVFHLIAKQPSCTVLTYIDMPF